jgi:mannose-6-phosphate isomerase
MQLYPLLFTPIFQERIWGGQNLKQTLGKVFDGNFIGESWELSGLANNESIVSNGILAGKTLTELIRTYKEDLVGNSIFERFGTSFPLLFKYLDACDNLSVQVHPSNYIAQKKHQCDGKTEMWYVVSASANANIIAGVKENIKLDDIKKGIENNSIEELLHFHDAKKGDVFHITEGIIHALGKGTIVAEIQQSSDITYRVYDYNRKDQHGKARDLHIQDALDCIVLSDVSKTNVNFSVAKIQQSLVTCPFFTTNLLSISEPTNFNYQTIDSFVVYMSIEGNYVVETPFSSMEVKKGDTLLIPSSVNDIRIMPKKGEKALILETYIQ